MATSAIVEVADTLRDGVTSGDDERLFFRGLLYAILFSGLIWGLLLAAVLAWMLG